MYIGVHIIYKIKYIGVHIIYKILKSKSQIALKNLQPQGFLKLRFILVLSNLLLDGLPVLPQPSVRIQTPCSVLPVEVQPKDNLKAVLLLVAYI